MIDVGMLDHQINAIAHIVEPIAQYRAHDGNGPLTDTEAKELIHFAKQAKFMVDGFLEIIDDLSYDKDRFEATIARFDDDYDALRDFTKRLNPSIASHHELLKLSNAILDGLIKVQNELGLIVSQHERHKKRPIRS